jgi:hypothetical protein
MKKTVILVLALFWAVSAMAQYAVAPEWYQGDLKKKGTVLALQGEKLDRATTEAILNQVGGPDMVAAWDKYRSERGWGIGLTAGGYTLAAAGVCFGGVYFIAGVVGSMFAAIGGQEAVDKVWADLGPKVQIGGVAMLTGFVAGTTGVVLLCVGNGNMRKLAQACDAAGLAPVTDLQLTFGPTPSGMGLALRF